MRVTRDSAVWWLGIVGAVVTYLAASRPVPEWDYYAWLQAVAFAVATVSGKLATSPLAGADRT